MEVPRPNYDREVYNSNVFVKEISSLIKMSRRYFTIDVKLHKIQLRFTPALRTDTCKISESQRPTKEIICTSSKSLNHLVGRVHYEDL